MRMVFIVEGEQYMFFIAEQKCIESSDEGISIYVVTNPILFKDVPWG